MPITTEIDYLDGDFTVQESEPATIQELIDLIGEEAVVENVNSNLRYRNKYPRVYRKVSEAINGEFPRAVKEEKKNKDGTVKNVLVSEMDHLRKYAESSPEASNRLQELFNQIAPSEPIYVKGERSGGGGKVSQAAQDSANTVIAAGDDKVESVVSKIEETVPGYKVGRDAEGNITPESLARGISALQRKLEQDAKKASKSLLGI